MSKKKRRDRQFDFAPDVKYRRSACDLSRDIKTTMTTGYLYPIEFTEVLPGDTFKCNTSSVIRVTSSFIKPVIDNLFFDVYHFWVPLRLLYDDYDKVFCGSNPSAYVEDDFKLMPVTSSTSTVELNTVAERLGLPLGQVPKGLNILPFRAFALIYNWFFRNENVVDEVYVNLGLTSGSEVINNEVWSPTNYFGKLPKVSKKRDYFTSCLPAQQKGQAPNIPINLTGFAPVHPRTNPIASGSFPAMSYTYAQGEISPIPEGTYDSVAYASSPTPYPTSYIRKSDTPLSDDGIMVYPANLWTDFDYVASSATGFFDMATLRFGAAVQKMLERDALYGGRINEYYLGHWGVDTGDTILQIPEYLGGSRTPLSIQQVSQTAPLSEGSTPLGTVAGTSLTNGYSHYVKSFSEFGYVMTVGCIRQLHTYSQGVDRAFFRRDRYDFYDPLFANLSEQPVYTAQIFAASQSDLKQNVFGYNEAWADYRYTPNIITGALRPSAQDSLDIWHFGDLYSNAPTLSKSFIEETPDYVDRTLSVESSAQDQFLLDIYMKRQAVRILPLYSIPGLIDHH